MSLTSHDKDYSDYITHLSSISGTIAFVCSLVFTSITLLLTQLQPAEKADIRAQSTLAILMFVFNLFLFLLAKNIADTRSLCGNLPKRSTADMIFTVLSFVGYCLWSLSLVIMFWLWDLTNIAILSLAAVTVNALLILIVVGRIH